MKVSTSIFKPKLWLCLVALLGLSLEKTSSQTLAFPGAQGFGRYAKGARGATTREVYIVTNLNDSGTGSFRDAVSKPGRFVVFAVGGIVNLSSDVVVSPNVTIAGQTAPGDGIVFFNKRVTFTGANDVICRYLRIRLGATNNSGKDASGLANGANMIFDHMSFTWAMDEVFSINWDSKGTSPDNITIQNSIIGQGLHRENHSAGGLIQTPDGGKVSLLQNLYISNKTRNPKVKGVNEFVNNVVYNWGNGNRLGDNLNYGWQGDAYIMGGSSGVSEVNVINNYFVGGPLTPPNKTTPFSRGTGTFNIHGSGNFYDNNKNGVLDGAEVPFDSIGYPGISGSAFKNQPFAYPAANPGMSAAQAYQYVINHVGANYPRRDQVDAFLVDEVESRGTKGHYVYRETDLPLSNGGLGDVFGGPAPLDTDKDGMPDAWEDANGLNKNDKADATAFSAVSPDYLNIEVYINSLIDTPPPAFIKPPSNVTLAASSRELPSPASKVVISWKDNSADEEYFILERSADGTTYTDIAHPAANATSYTDSVSLQPNRMYYYRLKSINGTNSSAYSAAVSITTPPIPTAPAPASKPTPANGEQYATPTAGKVTLRWSGSTNTITYTVYAGTDTANMVKQADVAYTASPSFQLAVNDSTRYFWRVDALNNKGIATGPVWTFRTSPVIPVGLVGHWAFDESIENETAVIDSSLYENHGILGLDADDEGIRIKGKLKNGLDFATASTDMYVVKIPNEDQLHLDKNSFSLSFWMKANPSLLPPDNNSSSYLLCKGSITRNANTGATGKRFDIEFKNKQIRFALDDDNDANGGGKDELQANGAPFFTGNWVHVVAIRDVEAKRLRIYMNGALYATSNITRSNAGIGEASALILGNIGELEFLATTNKPAPYKGMLDEIRIYNKVLSAAEITALASVKNTQTINFASLPAKQVDDADFAPGATASSGLPVTYTSSDTTVATIAGDKIRIIAAGTSVITASQAGDGSYHAAKPVSQTLIVEKKNQTITFSSIGEKTLGEPDFQISATASSGLPVVFHSSDSTVATVTNGLVQLLKKGVTTITASQPGNDVYGAAPSVSHILVVVADTIPPSVPTNLAGIATDSTVTLTWSASNDNIKVLGYKILQDGTEAYVLPESSNSLKIAGLSASQRYEFRVSAFDKAGNVSEAAILSITTPDTQAPTAPSMLTENKTNKHKVELNWIAATDNVGVSSYIVYRNGEQLSSSPVTGTSYLAERPIGRNVYEFTIKAMDEAGNLSISSNAVQVGNGKAGEKWMTASSASDFFVNRALEDVMIYPNPSAGNFKVQLGSSENGNVNISVFNASGVLVKSVSDKKEGAFVKDLQMQGLPAGVYYVRVNLNSFSSSKTIIIQ
ncbi:LamG-like jellyroll fold domain-containing protein [Pedobacter sp. SYSU D00535]|uniref:LamG-like jellyroll fold domain-containing protein n=1 Tax=Pedobacter sp. SYSU D00535 TaxID=2810308 RepID=UPI001A96060E|nr:LamG-like jellyroll fold domain-containing protein [Pedobacter sp. SYSU D00535]